MLKCHHIFIEELVLEMVKTSSFDIFKGHNIIWKWYVLLKTNSLIFHSFPSCLRGSLCTFISLSATICEPSTATFKENFYSRKNIYIARFRVSNSLVFSIKWFVIFMFIFAFNVRSCSPLIVVVVVVFFLILLFFVFWLGNTRQ